MTLRPLLFLPLLLGFSPVIDPPDPQFIRLALLPCELTAANCRVVATWTRGANYLAATDSIRALWRNNANLTGTALRRKFTDGTADTLSVPRPAVGTPLMVRLDICTYRIGFVDPACAPEVIFPMETQGVPPDPVTGIQVVPASASLRNGDTLRVLGRTPL